MPYVRTTWVDGSAPAIDAAGLNNIETGLVNIYAEVSAMETGGAAPGMVFATPDAFAGIDPTGATNSASGLTAALAASANKTLLIPPGTYLVNSRITVTNQSVRVSAHGATFLCGNNSSTEGSIFRFTSTMGTTRSVSGVSEAITTDGRFGSNGENMWVTSLTCTTTPTGIAAGDWIKIAADDLIADYQTGARSGQFARVVEVSGNVVVVAGELRDPFTTNIRLAKVNAAKVTWEGGTFRATDALLSGSTGVGSPLQFRWLLFPEVRSIHADKLAGPFLDLRGCYGASASDVSANWLQDASGSPGKYGYCVNDSSELSTITRIKATRVRHAFTTGTTSVPAGNADLGNFGRSFGAMVMDGVCHGATQTSWDTHGDADMTRFVNCQSHDSYSGFGLRGTNNAVIGGLIKGKHPGGACSVGTTSSSQNAYGSFFGGGLVLDGIASAAAFWISRDNGGVESRPTYVDGVTIVNRDTTKYIIRADYAAVGVGVVRVPAGGTRNSATNGGTIVAMPTLSV